MLSVVSSEQHKHPQPRGISGHSQLWGLPSFDAYFYSRHSARKCLNDSCKFTSLFSWTHGYLIRLHRQSSGKFEKTSHIASDHVIGRSTSKNKLLFMGGFPSQRANSAERFRVMMLSYIVTLEWGGGRVRILMNKVPLFPKSGILTSYKVWSRGKVLREVHVLITFWRRPTDMAFIPVYKCKIVYNLLCSLHTAFQVRPNILQI